MTSIDILAAALAATLVPGGVVEPVLAHRPDPGIDDDEDDEDEERPIGDPDAEEDYDDEDDEDDDEEPLRVGG
jgi:hypothetical protein